VAGFRLVFLPHIEIDHIDPGGNDYTSQKQKDAGVVMGKCVELMREYRSGQRSPYHDGGEDAKWSQQHPEKT
jgi:hypothetical protein